MGSRRAKSTSDQSIARRRAMGDTWEGAPNRLVRPNGTNPGDAAGRSMTGGPIQRARDRHHWVVPVVPAGEGPRAFLSVKPCLCPPCGVTPRAGLVQSQWVGVHCGRIADWCMGLVSHISLSPHGHVCGVSTACSGFASSQLCAGSTSS